MKINSIYSQLNNITSNIAFKRMNRDKNEDLKQFELNRNKSLDYVCTQQDKDFFEYVTEERAKGITANIPPQIKSKLYAEQSGIIKTHCYAGVKEYDPFNYPQLYRGIGKSELDALREGKQIYSSERAEYYGVDVTNAPGGIGYGDYLVKFKLKPNLDLFIGSEYNSHLFSKGEHSMPHIYEWGPLPRNSLSRHTIIAGTYTLNDVEEITDIETNKIVYSSKDEKIPDKKEMLANLHSSDKKVAITALENLQTYTGHGDEFLEEAQFFLDSTDAEVRTSYLNAIYNYGTKKDLEIVLDFMQRQENLSPDEIAKILNCIEQFGEKGKQDKAITYLIEKILKIENKADLEFVCENLYGAISLAHYDIENNYSTLKKYLTLSCLPLSKLILDIVPPCEETDDFVTKLISSEGNIKQDMKWRRTLKWYSMGRSYTLSTPNPIPDCFYKDEKRDFDY